MENLMIHYVENEEIVEVLENTELIKIVEQRSATPLSKYVSSEDMAMKFNIDLNSYKKAVEQRS
jgi:hypothetical protein